jgi:hypothetical protein
MVARQLDHLTPEEGQIIEAASVRGMEFSADALAVGLEANEVAVETCCDELVRRGLVLRAVGNIAQLDGAMTRYARFSEGFDTADPQAATALLGRPRYTGIERLV